MYILILCNAQIVLRYTMHIGYPIHIATAVLLDDHACMGAACATIGTVVQHVLRGIMQSLS